MNKLELLKQITATYQKYGWTLRRILLTECTQREIGDLIKDFANENVALETDSIDAIWFVRAAGGGREAWELRLLQSAPYALFESFDLNMLESERENARRKMVSRAKNAKSQTSN